MRDDVYRFVWNFLRMLNHGVKPVYVSLDKVLKKVYERFGDSSDVSFAGESAFYEYYESDEFMKKLE